MSEPRWLTFQHVRAIHAAQIERFGGVPGLRDEGLLLSALARPQHRWSYGSAVWPELAASLGFGIVRNHPFIDGNKRTGFVALAVFLRWNGVAFRPDQDDATNTFLKLASGELTEVHLAEWVGDVISGSA
jgi:death-on-curing protein